MHTPESFLFGNKAAQSIFKKRIWYIYRIPLIVFFKGFVKNIHVLNREQLNSLMAIEFGGNINLIPNSVYRKAEGIEFNNKEFIVLFTGTQSIGIKGADLLVEIMKITLKKHTEVKFCITGGFGDGTTLINQLASTYPDFIINRGFVSEEELIQIHRKASIFIITSKIDTFSLGVVGAQGYGLPCIAFNIPGPSDIIKEPFQGVLIDPFDVTKFSEEVLKYYELWKTDRQNFNTLRNKIQTYIYDTLGLERIFPKLVQLLVEK